MNERSILKGAGHEEERRPDAVAGQPTVQLDAELLEDRITPIIAVIVGL